jgi:hypothetical protein
VILVVQFDAFVMDVNETQKSVLRLLKHPLSLLRDILIREISFLL